MTAQNHEISNFRKTCVFMTFRLMKYFLISIVQRVKKMRKTYNVLCIGEVLDNMYTLFGNGSKNCNKMLEFE